MNAWKVILATILIFSTGVMTGGLLVHRVDRLHSRHSQERTASGNTRTNSASGQRYEFLRRMERELDLSSEQRQRVEAIFQQSQERTKKLLDPVKPAMQEESRRVREEFRATLNPDQRTRFDQLWKAQHPRDAHRGALEHQPTSEKVEAK